MLTRTPDALGRTMHGDTAAMERREWKVSGRVQGVGFRPFVYRIAREYGLTGFVLNDGAGVTIEAQGLAQDLDLFIHDLKTKKPALAIIQKASARNLSVKFEDDNFVIAQSETTPSPRAAIAPDLAVCADCARDVRDKADRRRFHYALTNCTACGPRFSIIRAVPYDRPNTTMAPFKMCGDCRREYDDPADRRFHAQPTACYCCGPKLEFVDPRGSKNIGDPITLTVERLLAGQILAIQGIGGFHLAVRGDSDTAVQRLRQIKHRPCKPFALMIATAEDAARIVQLSGRAVRELCSSAAPIVLATRRDNAPVAASVAPRCHRLGVMLAYTPLHQLIFDAMRDRCGVLVMTSANDSDEPLIFTHEEAISHLRESCDGILWHERPIERSVDDSVIIDRGERDPIIVRRSRGYVPTPINLPPACRSTGVCLGGELKNTLAVVRDEEVVLSQHLGDLENARTYAAFKRATRDLIELLGVEPRWVAHDMHPTYVSTLFGAQLAQSLHVPRMKFQHHHAHAASVLAEHGEIGPALAVVCDGTGYGTDGTAWGGELMLVSLKGFRRLGRIRPMLLPGGDAAAKQTWRCGMSLLLNAFGDGFGDLPLCSYMAPDGEREKFVKEMLRTKTSCVLSSAAGRLFDGVAAILGLASENRFEAQAPMALESAAAWEAAVMRAVEKTGLISVALSGGVMCNQIIDRLITDRLRKRGLHVLRHRLVPPNDGGLALGQAALAAYQTSTRSRRGGEPCA